MIDDEGGGENVIGYLEGKGDNHLSNPPSYPLGPITWDRMALSSAVSQLTPSQPLSLTLTLSNTHLTLSVLHILTHLTLTHSHTHTLKHSSTHTLKHPPHLWASEMQNQTCSYSDSQDDGPHQNDLQ